MKRTAKRFALAVLSGLMLIASVSATPQGQQQQQPQQPQWTKEEADAYNAVFQAYNAGKFNDAIKGGEEFLSKFPNSVLAPRTKPILVVCYIQTNNLDKVFEIGGQVVSADPNNFQMPYALALTASSASKGGNTKYDADGMKYATKVLEVANGGQPPAGVDPNAWQTQKSKIAAEMEQAIGLFLHNKPDYEAAIQHLKAASELNPKDPLNVYLMAESLKLGKYKKLQEDYSKLTDDEKIGDQGKELLKQVDEVVDQMIDIYAKTVALTDGDAQFQQLGEVAKQTLEGFYKYRHNNTTEGLDDLIKKYKSS